MGGKHSISRRQFLERSFAFSAAASLMGCAAWEGSAVEKDPVLGGISHILMVGDWGIDTGAVDQAQVAAAMKTYLTEHKLDADALFMLGDNFYGNMPGGLNSERWQSSFEDVYPAKNFPGPAYAVLGNHDYQYAPQSKVEPQLEYSLQGKSRWTMPDRYYSFLFPAVAPTVTVIALDSNMPNERAQPFPPDSSFYTPTDAQRLVQLAWLEAELAKPLTTPYRIVVGHHPLFSNGPHGDNQTLIRDWDPLFRQYGVDLYLGGHDHDLQHLEFAGHPTSFVSSGGGGAGLNKLRASVASRGPFADEVHGFTHLQVKPGLMTVRHVDVNGGLLHKFTRTPDGVVKILK